jgi:probable rRNA maturation factor
MTVRVASGIEPSVDVLVQSDLWAAQPDAERMVRRAISAAAAGMLTRTEELAVVLADDSAVRELNRIWRGKDAPTNVLSFPAAPAGADAATGVLGDVVLAYETIARESDLERKPFDHHLVHLVVHGFLHLLGYDHETDAEAEKMEAAERKILAGLDVPDPYASPDAA